MSTLTDSSAPASTAPALATAPPATGVAQPHTLFEDVQGFLIGGVLSSLGLAMFNVNGLMTGGTAGLAFLLHYLSGIGVGFSFLLLNLPFFVLAWRQLGWRFTVKSFVAVALLGVLVDCMPRVLVFTSIAPLYSALAGGLLLGMGVLAFVRHGSSLGGINILAVVLQKRRGWSAGRLQMGVDVAITAAAFLVLQPVQVLHSVIGAVMLGGVLAINHKPGRYMGV